ncbi:transposase [Pseudemcibacter aquimaris]|nr:transposase [Pseudemcibacter aquimaris]
MMFKILIQQAMYDLLDDKAEFMIRDRLSFMSFLGLLVLAMWSQMPKRSGCSANS